jgi:two-component system, LytTR family, response regulator
MIYRAIIADDEEMARLRLRRLLAENFDEIEVVAEANDGVSARTMIEKYKPDVVFMDIDMPGLSGMEVAKDACKNIFVIFVTAYNQYALEAFKALAVDYILKPIGEDDLRHAIDKLKKLTKPREINGIIDEVARWIKSSERIHRIKVFVGETIKLIPCEDVVCLEADQKYTTIHTRDSNRYLTDQTIRELEHSLPKPDFIRIHRKHIINSKLIKELKRIDDRKFKVVLKIPFYRELIVGRHFLADVLQIE